MVEVRAGPDLRASRNAPHLSAAVAGAGGCQCRDAALEIRSRHDSCNKERSIARDRTCRRCLVECRGHVEVDALSPRQRASEWKAASQALHVHGALHASGDGSAG